MARPKREINPERGKRLKILLKETNTKQKELSELIHITPQTISQIINGKANLTPETAELIISNFPQFSIHWLLCDVPLELKSDDVILSETMDRFQFLYEFAIGKKKEQRLAVLDVVKCCGFIVGRENESFTIQKSGTTGKITISEAEAFEYCDEINAMVKAFVEYHIFQRRRITSYKVIRKEK